MHETNSLEKELQSWTPRRPSAKIARRLFAGAAPARAFLRSTEVWHWLTPVAACVLTLMVVVHGAGRQLPRLSAQDNATFFAAIMLHAASSNVQQTFLLSKMDENVEWNVWPHPSLNLGSVMPTNR